MVELMPEEYQDVDGGKILRFFHVAGQQSVEVMILLLLCKVKFLENFCMLRGNQEWAAITRINGFYDDCKRRYGIKRWKAFCDLCNCLSFVAIVGEKIFCCAEACQFRSPAWHGVVLADGERVITGSAENTAKI